MIGGDGDAEGDRAVAKAKDAFAATAATQLKGLMADGVDGGAASTQLMDELLQHRGLGHQGLGGAGGDRLSVWNSPDLQHVVRSTGFSEAQAARTLLLRDEIAQLRLQGHSTPALIDQLNRRLRNASGRRKERTHENAGRPSPAWTQQAKKLKLSGDELGAFSAARALPALPDPGVLRPHHRTSHEKRGRDDGHISQLKKTARLGRADAAL